jgi:hypothetical protein
MNISDVVGRKAMVQFHSSKGLESLGIDASSKYCRIVGYDSIGLWVENPSYEETPLRDEQGNLLSPEQRTKRSYTAHILIPWGNVQAIVHFPGRAPEEDMVSEEVRPIGSYL